MAVAVCIGFICFPPSLPHSPRAALFSRMLPVVIATPGSTLPCTLCVYQTIHEKYCDYSPYSVRQFYSTLWLVARTIHAKIDTHVSISDPCWSPLLFNYSNCFLARSVAVRFLCLIPLGQYYRCM